MSDYNWIAEQQDPNLFHAVYSKATISRCGKAMPRNPAASSLTPHGTPCKACLELLLAHGEKIQIPVNVGGGKVPNPTLIYDKEPVTLRDLFAAFAVCGTADDFTDEDAETIAESAYALADEMLKRRAK